MSLRKSNPFGAQYETSQDDTYDALKSSSSSVSSAHHRQQDSMTFAPSFAFYDTQGGDDWSPSPVHRQSRRVQQQHHHTSKPAKKSTQRSSVEAPAASSSYTVVATVLPSKRRALSTSAYVSKARASTSAAASKMEDVLDLTEVMPDEEAYPTRSDVTRGGTKPARRVAAPPTAGTSSPRRAFVRVDTLKKESSPNHLVKSSGAQRIVVSKPRNSVSVKRVIAVAPSSRSKSAAPSSSSGARRVIMKR